MIARWNANGIGLDDEMGLSQYLLVSSLKSITNRLFKLIIAEEHIIQDEEYHDYVDHKRVDTVSYNL